jgi:hypothetical protein
VFKYPGNFCAVCPLKLTKEPTEPCPRALERVHAIQAEGNKSKADPDSLPGCPWAINSAEHNYCFWNLYKDLDHNPIPDKEICNLLGISQQTLEKTFQSMIVKLQALRGTKVMDDLVEAIMERLATQDPDYTIYLPDSYAKATPTDEEIPEEPDEDEDAKLAEEATKKPRKNRGMPTHRSGNKSDLYGLYSKKALIEARKKKSEKK